MSKLSWEDKINICQERKQGNTIKNISKKYGVRIDVIKYLVRLVDKHGYDILRTNKNKQHNKCLCCLNGIPKCLSLAHYPSWQKPTW